LNTSTQPLKWFGGQACFAAQIVARMPRHRHYVEPFAGGLAVLLERDPNDPSLWWADSAQDGGVSEVVNDLDGRLTNFWRVLRSETQFPKFLRAAESTEFGRKVYEQATASVNLILDGGPDGDWRAAWAFFVACRQSRAGTFKGFTTLTRSRTRRGVNGNVSEWLGAVDGLSSVHARLRPVVVENVPAVKLIVREDTEGALMYLDPPYLHETRTTKAGYAYEMTEADHRELLATITHPGRKSKFMLSGYRSDLYDQSLAGWTRHEFEKANNAAGGTAKRRITACLWCNF
jgi:DNA adenine methylase